MKKVKIYTIADKAPYFIPWQRKSLERVKDDFEYIVLNNNSSEELDRDIKNHCNSLAIQCIDVEKKDFSHQVFACSSPTQEIIDKFISQDRDCIHVIIDSDLFLMRDFSFNDIIDGYDIAGLPQARDLGGGYGEAEYLWNCFLIFNTTAPNMDKFKMWPGTINHAPCDVGGMSYFYLLYNDIKLRRISSTGIIIDHPQVMSLLPESFVKDYDFNYDMEIIEGKWLHFRGGSRWDNKKKRYYEAKEGFIKKMLGA